MKDYDITRNILVVLDFENVSWFDMLPIRILEALSDSIVFDSLLLVFAFVALVSLEVLKGILEHRNDDNSTERGSLNRFTI